MTVGPQDLAAFIGRLDQAIIREEQRLNAADAKLGDGDTGSMLRRVVAAMAASDAASADDLAEAAMRVARAAMKETGSSLGTIVATAAMTLAKEARAKGGGLRDDDMGQVAAAIRDAVQARGKASPGDKTVVDSLDFIAQAGEGAPLTVESAAGAAAAALDALRDKPCRIGRARMFPERSVGADDPGMLAVALLLEDCARTSVAEPDTNATT